MASNFKMGRGTKLCHVPVLLMIAKYTIRLLITKRLLDAKVLLNNRRYLACIYMAGYALELTFKYRISRIMQFHRGFPENKSEFDAYYSDTRKILLRTTIRELRDIRHHNLPLLLRYSGEQVNIENRFREEWKVVKDWDPGMRYTNPIIRKQKAVDFLKNCRTIINQII